MQNYVPTTQLREPSSIQVSSSEEADREEHTATNQLTSSTVVIEDSTEKTKTYQRNIVNSEATRDHIANDLLEKLENGCKVVMEEIADTSADAWEIIMERENYVAKRRMNSNYLHLKVESELPYHILDVFSSLVDPKRTKANPNIQSAEVMKVYSNHTWLTFTVYKAVSKHCVLLCSVHLNLFRLSCPKLTMTFDF